MILYWHASLNYYKRTLVNKTYKKGGGEAFRHIEKGEAFMCIKRGGGIAGKVKIREGQMKGYYSRNRSKEQGWV